MSVISNAFLLFFLPTTLLLYWFVFWSPYLKLWALLLLSLAFYALAGTIYLPILLLLSLLTFFLARWQMTNTLAIVLNLVALAFFKYWGFGVENLNALAERFQVESALPIFNLALPLGISFYTFKHIGYLIDVRQKRYLPSNDLLAFLSFSALFMQISAGPISGFEESSKQLRNLPNHLSSEQIYNGMLHISMGLAKKLLIADVLGRGLANTLYNPSGMLEGATLAWFHVAVYGLQLYFDFSGYTDIVLGVGLLFGLKLPANFDNPYLARDPGQFWQRWHMSASTWFRLYLFTPISRKLLRKKWLPLRRTLAQVIANLWTMFLIGLWHGAGWGFILWGVYHGVLLSLNGIASRLKFRIPLPFVSNILLLAAVLVGWALFLSPDLAFALNLLEHMFGQHGLGEVASIEAVYDPQVLLVVLVAVLITLSGRAEAANMPHRNPVHAFFFGLLAIISLLQLGESVQFVYVNF